MAAYFEAIFNHRYIFNTAFLKYDALFFLILFISYVLSSKIIKFTFALRNSSIRNEYDKTYVIFSFIYVTIVAGIYELFSNIDTIFDANDLSLVVRILSILCLKILLK